MLRAPFSPRYRRKRAASSFMPLMVPFTNAAVPKIDMAERRMIVVPLAETE